VHTRDDAFFMATLWNTAGHYVFALWFLCFFFFFFMAALCDRAGHYIFVLWFLLSSSVYLLFSSPDLSGRRLDV